MIMSLVGSDVKPQLLPIKSLKIFGSNPFNEPMFRVVWSESRYYLVGALHTEYDGDPSDDKTVTTRGKDPNVTKKEVCYKWLPLYPGRKIWILELWKSAIGATGCATREQYDLRYKDPLSGLLTLGPYPARGEYYECFAFPNQPTYSVVYNTVNRIRAGWNYSYNDHLAANNVEMEKQEKVKFDKVKDIFLDSQQAFKNRPSNVRTGKRTKDHLKFRYSAEDLKIHKRGFSVVGG